MSAISTSLPDYERHLLIALAVFLGRDPEVQARACLCMYLRQAEPRIMAQVNYYAHRYGVATGEAMEGYDLLTLLADSPQSLREVLPDLGRVHEDQQPDVFDSPGVVDQPAPNP
ncbi:MAG: hypothetical protein KGQ93_00895 [Cyanobacteria bacterium REEB459]|nr:hypothetical protein [Cyanobacteria bacterium REEB459]